MNKCDLPLTPAAASVCVCVRACQFNEWEPVTHQTGVLIVSEMKLKTSAAAAPHKQSLALVPPLPSPPRRLATDQAAISQGSRRRPPPLEPPIPGRGWDMGRGHTTAW